MPDSSTAEDLVRETFLRVWIRIQASGRAAAHWDRGCAGHCAQSRRSPQAL
jgi:DNA-directed RNA polymerase specialized sigma24 family protein